MSSKRNSKILCSLILVMIVLMLFAGCGSRKSEVQGVEEKDNGVIEIEYWYGFGGTLGDAMETIIQDFNASQDRIRVVGVQQSSYEETMKLLQASIAANNPPACCLLDMTYTTAFMEKGLLENLDPYISADEDYRFEDILESLLIYGKDHTGAIYALPAYGSTHFMFYRKDIFEQLELDPEEVFCSWQSLAEASQKIKKETGMYGWDPMYDWQHFVDIADAAGGSVLSEDKKRVTFDSLEWIEAMEQIRKWIYEEEIMKINFGGEGWEYWYKTMDDVLQGRTAGYTGASADISDLDFDVVAAHTQPGWNENGAAPFAAAVMNQIMANASESEKLAAFEWISYFSSTEVNAKFCTLSGYIPVRESCTEQQIYKKYVEETPAVDVAFEQIKNGDTAFIDPTGGKIKQALVDALDLILIENIPADEALHKMQPIAQEALDEYWNSRQN